MAVVQFPNPPEWISGDVRRVRHFPDGAVIYDIRIPRGRIARLLMGEKWETRGALPDGTILRANELRWLSYKAHAAHSPNRRAI